MTDDTPDPDLTVVLYRQPLAFCSQSPEFLSELPAQYSA
jgi:hypothetical protein